MSRLLAVLAIAYLLLLAWFRVSQAATNWPVDREREPVWFV